MLTTNPVSHESFWHLIIVFFIFSNNFWFFEKVSKLIQAEQVQKLFMVNLRIHKGASNVEGCLNFLQKQCLFSTAYLRVKLIQRWFCSMLLMNLFLFCSLSCCHVTPTSWVCYRSCQLEHQTILHRKFFSVSREVIARWGETLKIVWWIF